MAQNNTVSQNTATSDAIKTQINSDDTFKILLGDQRASYLNDINSYNYKTWITSQSKYVKWLKQYPNYASYIFKDLIKTISGNISDINLFNNTLPAKHNESKQDKSDDLKQDKPENKTQINTDDNFKILLSNQQTKESTLKDDATDKYNALVSIYEDFSDYILFHKLPILRLLLIIELYNERKQIKNIKESIRYAHKRLKQIPDPVQQVELPVHLYCVETHTDNTLSFEISNAVNAICSSINRLLSGLDIYYG
jgi:hypothetical protein